MADAVRVKGLREFNRYLTNLGVDLGDLKDVMRDVGALVADTARPLTRPKSHRLANSIRPARAKNRATVRAGGASVPYAGPQHFGWAARNITPKLYLYTALDRRRTDVLAAFDKGLDKIIH